MEISVKTTKLDNAENGVKGLATVSFGNAIKVQSIAVMEGKNGMFVAMPSYQSKQKDEAGNQIRKDICNPITKDFREQLYKAILESYEKGSEVKFTLPTEKDEPSIGVKTHAIDKGNTKAIGQIYVENCFVVNNVSVMSGKNGLFVSMPAYKTKEVAEDGKPVYKDICYSPDKDFRDKIRHELVEDYLEGIAGIKDQVQSAPTHNDGFMNIPEGEDLPFVDGEKPLEITYAKEESKEAKKATPRKEDKEPKKQSIKDKLAAGEAKKNAKLAEKAAEPKTPKAKNAEIA